MRSTISLPVAGLCCHEGNGPVAHNVINDLNALNGHSINNGHKFHAAANGKNHNGYIANTSL